MVAGLAGDVLGSGICEDQTKMRGNIMVGNKIRALRARLTLLSVEDDGMSTVEYSTV